MIHVIFQQDGAPPHFSISIRHYLDNHFPNRWIGRGAAIRWTLRSVDLTPLDFYLCGYLKSNVYESPIKDIDELKMRINVEMKSISKGTLNNVFLNIVKRMNQ